MADNKEVAMLFDSSHCTGCRGCQVACKQWNVLPASLELNANEKNFNGTYQGPLDLNGDTRLIMTFDEKPSGDKFHPVNWSIGRRSCYHCTDAGCVKACSSGALSKDERGVVKLDTDKCNGCTFCQAACPFDVPRFRPMDGRIDKCTLCIDRLDNGGIPALTVMKPMACRRIRSPKQCSTALTSSSRLPLWVRPPSSVPWPSRSSPISATAARRSPLRKRKHIGRPNSAPSRSGKPAKRSKRFNPAKTPIKETS